MFALVGTPRVLRRHKCSEAVFLVIHSLSTLRCEHSPRSPPYNLASVNRLDAPKIQLLKSLI